MTNSKGVQQAEYLLQRMLFDPSISSQVGDYVWAMEADRWNELVFTLITRETNLSADEARMLTQYLSDLGHLNIPALAEIPFSGGAIDESDDQTQKILAILHDKGVANDQAFSVITRLCQLANGLQSHFGGKIQRYLRHYGEAILRDLPDFFSSARADDQLRHIISSWIQDVLNMPISHEESSITEFCQTNGITTDELWQAADNLDLNFAVVDDLVGHSAG